MNWLQVFLHLAGAVVICAIGAFSWYAAAFNSIFWLGREAWQRHGKGKPMFEEWSDNNLWEGFAPTVLGFALAWLASR